MSKLLGGMDASGFARLNGADLATETYVDTAIAGLTFDSVNLSSESTIADYVTAHGTSLSEGSLVILENAPKGSQKWVQNGGTSGTVADFTNIDSVLSEAEVRAMFAGSASVDITGGVVSVKDGAITPAKLSADVLLAMGKAIGFAQNITGDGTTTTFNIQHNANTIDIMNPVMRDVASGEFVEAQYIVVDANNLSVVFAVAPAVGKEYRVLLKKF